jgi:hypothetical protein
VGWVEFVATVIKAGMWPITVLVVVLLFRSKLTEVLGSGLTRLKAGPFEAEWKQAALEAQAAVEIENSDSVPTVPSGPPVADEDVLDRLRQLIPPSPELAIIGGFQVVERRLRQLVGEQGDQRQLRQRFREDVFGLFRRGLISEASIVAFDNVRRLRNLAAHQPERVTARQAVEYLDLVDALIGQLDQAEKLAGAGGLFGASAGQEE